MAPIGMSPSVVTEFLQYVDDYLDQRVSELTVIATEEIMVRDSVILVEASVKKYPYVHIHVVELPLSNISTQEDSLEFMRICAEILREQREVHKVDRMYLCVAGGRKDMCIGLALLGQYFGISGVHHVIMHDVKAYNVQLERFRHAISELASSSDKDGYHEKSREAFEDLMFPHPSSYAVIKVPIIPYPRTALNDIVALLRRTKALRRIDSWLPLDVLERMSISGLIKLTSNRIYVTDEGRQMSKILSGV
ncbi:MAG: hypothetical protein JRJ77_07380 [Deltaproteobacteria bacterium]|nr:hypothetical protein [Deltaproteobacteria bacterium]